MDPEGFSPDTDPTFQLVSDPNPTFHFVPDPDATPHKDKAIIHNFNCII